MDLMTSEMVETTRNHAILALSKDARETLPSSGFSFILTNHFHLFKNKILNSSTNSEMTSQFLSSAQTLDKVTQYVDESVFQL